MSRKLVTPSEYTESGKHLPEFMRDFHNQKDLFKTIHKLYGIENLNWVDAHVYTIDSFLWFMAQHGYILQRSKKTNVTYYDLNEKVNTTTDNSKTKANKCLIKCLNGL